jgi:Ca2+-binding EF-hand superfamily protein
MSYPPRNPSLLDIVASYSAFPQPDPSRRPPPFPRPACPDDEEELGRLFDKADPAQSHLDPEFSCSYLHLNLSECRALVEQFRAADPENSGLTQEQFSQVTGAFLGSKTTSEPAAIFAMFDTTCSGRVTLREFLCGYAILCKGTTDTRIRYIFNMFDIHDEGVLKRSQLTAALNLIAGHARSAEAAAKAAPEAPAASSPIPIPLSGTGQSDGGDELPGVSACAQAGSGGDDDGNGDGGDDDGQDPESLVEEIVDSLLDGNDRISYEAFISMCKEEENVLLWLEKLADATGEFLDESVRAASERHVVELSMQRARVIGIGSPPPVGRHVPLDPPLPVSSGSTTAAPPTRASSLLSGRAQLAAPSAPGAATVAAAATGADATPALSRAESSEPNHPVLVRRSKASVSTPEDAVKQPFIIDFEQIKFDKVIGRGACATVWAGEWLHMPVAVKVFNEDEEPQGGAEGGGTGAGSVDRKLVGDLIAEAGVLMQVRHPNVCLFLCLCIEPKVCVVSELYLGGSVHDFLHGLNRRRFGTRQALEMITNVARGMMYLHFSEPVILHRDLKTRNILIDRGVTHCVICDFGVSRLQDLSQTAGAMSGRGGMVGSVNTMAPEVMEGKTYTRAADVYSFAMVAYEMFTGCVPFEGMRAIQLMFMVTEGARPEINEALFPPTLGELLEQCWAPDPESRPDFDSIMTRLAGDTLAREMDQLVERQSADNEEVLSGGPEGTSKALMDVVHAGDIDEARRLLLIGADVQYADYDSRTALHIACAEGHGEIVDSLLEAGADVAAKDRWGGTALDDARRHGNDAIVNRLIGAGALSYGEPAIVDDVTPLGAEKRPPGPNLQWTRPSQRRMAEVQGNVEFMLAVFAGDLATCRAAIVAGHSVDASDYDGRTPCHLAVSEGHIGIVSLLVDRGCDTMICDRWGYTALDEAKRLGRSKIAVLIGAAQLRDRARKSSVLENGPVAVRSHCEFQQPL